MTGSSAWIAERPLVLASTSGVRRMLLQSAGLSVEVAPSGVDERAVEEAVRDERLDPSGLARRLAAEKALAVSRRMPDRLVLGADQTLELDGLPLHKPADRPQARERLRALSGRTHALRSAVALAHGGRLLQDILDSAFLDMRPLSDAAVERYLDLAGHKATESVGGYQVEALGIHLFDAVRGDHSTILGLPLPPVLAALRRMGCLAF